jgi:hypothetical protein
MGLLMGTPLTICIVVLASHVPGMKFLSTLLADTPALPADMHYYQRLLAHDPSEASDVIDRHLKAEAPETVYDALLIPALNLRQAGSIWRSACPRTRSRRSSTPRASSWTMSPPRPACCQERVERGSGPRWRADRRL